MGHCHRKMAWMVGSIKGMFCFGMVQKWTHHNICNPNGPLKHIFFNKNVHKNDPQEGIFRSKLYFLGHNWAFKEIFFQQFSSTKNKFLRCMS